MADHLGHRAFVAIEMGQGVTQFAQLARCHGRKRVKIQRQ